MIIRPDSKRRHPVLDPDAARRAFEAADIDRDLSGELITSPHDLYSVETLRDTHDLRVGDPVPTDVFVFGFGEPDDHACTKLGGRPFWPADRPWPRLPDGSPWRFLAQLNFADSLDILPELPASILVLLTDSEEDWIWEPGPGLAFHWVPGDCVPATGLEVPSTIGAAGPFFGAIHRTADYPDAGDRAAGLDVSQSWNLPILNGTKIGGLPHVIQGDDGDVAERFLCQLGSIQAAPRVPYPWVNRREPLQLDFGSPDSIFAEVNDATFGDMGSIYMFLGDDGDVRRSFESY